MAYISPRVLAVDTLGVAATLVVASGAANVFFSSNPLRNHTCTGYGYHSRCGYGYDCTPNPTPVPPTGGSTSGLGGGSFSAQVSTTQNVAVQTPGVRPTIKIFQNFVKNCEHSVRDSSDSRFKSYYDVLQVIDRTNCLVNGRNTQNGNTT